jgi:soluble lytic murein transglycosylase
VGRPRVRAGRGRGRPAPSRPAGAAGLRDARDAEYQAALRAFERKPLATLVLAEGIRDRNEPVEAIRLGRSLLQERGGSGTSASCASSIPSPIRELIVAESRRAGIDPLLYAALVRQESTFRPAVKSWVGATGLGQIMPATGQWLAPMIGIRNYDHSLLEVPEVNLRMGTKYLADLLVRYNGATDLALAGYNAGPGRADRWRREFNYGRDTDAFRAMRFPFDETRNYVMIVLRNAAIYERLYGDPRDGIGSGRGAPPDPFRRPKGGSPE